MTVVMAGGKLLVTQFKPDQVIRSVTVLILPISMFFHSKTLKLFWVWIGCPIMEHTLIVKRRQCLFGSLEVGESLIKQISTPMWRLEFNSIL
jgi:hypothetical protein